MNPDPKTGTDEALPPELDRHLSDPAQKTEEVSGEQDRARRPDRTPAETDDTTENQPT